jgi:hypothetical protein
LPIANIGNDWEMVWNKNYPNNRRIIAKSPFSLLPNYRWSKAKGANPQNACLLPILAMIGKWYGIKITQIIAAL